MENASKALIIAGGILIAILVISIGVYLFANYADMGSSYEQNFSTAETQKFNVNFTKFKDRNDITIQEIVTLVNFAKQYKEKTEINVTISIPSKPDLITYLETNPSGSISRDEKIIEDLIKENSDKKFTCTNIEYGNDGRVNIISFN